MNLIKTVKIMPCYVPAIVSYDNSREAYLNWEEATQTMLVILKIASRACARLHRFDSMNIDES